MHAPTSVATATPASSLSRLDARTTATAPVTMAVRARLAVYDAQRRYGERSSGKKDAPATRAAARGPNKTAAKRIGTSEIDSERFALRCTRPRSEIAATSA